MQTFAKSVGRPSVQRKANKPIHIDLRYICIVHLFVQQTANKRLPTSVAGSGPLFVQQTANKPIHADVRYISRSLIRQTNSEQTHSCRRSLHLLSVKQIANKPIHTDIRYTCRSPVSPANSVWSPICTANSEQTHSYRRSLISRSTTLKEGSFTVPSVCHRDELQSGAAR